MKLKTIKDRKMFDAYVASHPYSHYMKTSMWGRFQLRTNQYEYELLGFYEEDVLVGTAMALLGKFLTHSFIYIPKGPCIDYDDAQMVERAFSLLKKYASQKKVDFLRIDPNVLRKERDIYGEGIPAGINHEHVTEHLKQLGYVHKGYNYAYDGSWSNRYTLTVDLHDDFDVVSKRFNKSRLTSINRHSVNCVETRIGTSEDIPYLMRFEEELSMAEGFKPHTREFFENLLDVFRDHAVLYVTSVDLEGMTKNIRKELSGKKYAKDPEAREAKQRSLADTTGLRLLNGDQVNIAAGIFVRIGEKSYDLYTYNDKSYNHLNPVDSLHFFAMQDMKDHGVTTYDMCGFSGVTTKDDPEYGLYEYKSSFGADFIEDIGEFDYPVREGAWKRFKLEKRAEVKFRRMYWQRKYKKDIKKPAIQTGSVVEETTQSIPIINEDDYE